MTGAERALWRLLRQGPQAAKFRCQHPFGPYILDFYCIEKKFAIEADGSQYLTPEGLAAGAARTQYLDQRGIRVLRFTNREILQETEAVLEVIQETLATPSGPTGPSP